MKYFSKISLKGYKSIQDIELDLYPGVNILIGPNGSGKSNLLTFISYLKDEILDLNVEYSVEAIWFLEQRKFTKKINQINNFDLFNQPLDLELLKKYQIFESSKKISYQLFLEDKELLNIDPSQHVSDFDVRNKFKNEYPEEDSPFLDDIKFVKYGEPIDRNFLIAPINIPNNFDAIINFFGKDNPFSNRVALTILLSQKFIDENGSSSINFIKEQFRNLHLDLFDTLERYTEVKEFRFSEILEVSKSESGLVIENIQLQFKLGNRWYKWEDLSDGTRRIISLILDVYYCKDLALIEEPELGIHPRQLFKLLDFLKDQSREKQLILSTHSPEVLDILRLDQLANINLISMKNGSTQVKKLSKKQRKKAESYFDEIGTLGDYWKYSDLEL